MRELVNGHRRRLVGVSAVLLIVAAIYTSILTDALAAFTTTPSVTQGTISTATLAPPTAVTATGACQALVLGPEIQLAWTATSSTYATGYKIYRSTTNGGPYTLVTTVTGRSTTSYTDTGASGFATTYYYVLTALYLNWISINSTQATGTTPTLCL